MRKCSIKKLYSLRTVDVIIILKSFSNTNSFEPQNFLIIFLQKSVYWTKIVNLVSFNVFFSFGYDIQSMLEHMSIYQLNIVLSHDNLKHWWKILRKVRPSFIQLLIEMSPNSVTTSNSSGSLGEIFSTQTIMIRKEINKNL